MGQTFSEFGDGLLDAMDNQIDLFVAKSLHLGRSPDTKI